MIFIKYFYLLIIIAAIINRSVITGKIVKRKRAIGEIYQKWITKLVFIFYILVFISPAIEFLLLNRKINYYVSVSAFVIYLIGMYFWMWAINSLGKYWSVDIEIRSEQTLIRTGPYKYFRHPHYLFLFTELLITLRIIYEEKELTKKFGEQYLNYKKEVWGLFPIPIFKSGVKD
jgi:protein-S-isoprenylcysteine O-methyltransferase Ste14